MKHLKPTQILTIANYIVLAVAVYFLFTGATITATFLILTFGLNEVRIELDKIKAAIGMPRRVRA